MDDRLADLTVRWRFDDGTDEFPALNDTEMQELCELQLAEIDRLSAALRTCDELARGDQHMLPSRRCDAIQDYVARMLCDRACKVTAATAKVHEIVHTVGVKVADPGELLPLTEDTQSLLENIVPLEVCQQYYNIIMRLIERDSALMGAVKQPAGGVPGKLVR